MPRRPISRRVPWAAYLWPGLPHLWNEGSWAGFLLALGFTALLNTLVLTVFVWPEWLPERVKLACGLSTALLWLAALIETRQELRRQAARREVDPESAEEDAPTADDGSLAPAGEPEPRSQQLDAFFVKAQREYLAGDWVAAERTLRELRRVDRDDIEGQLLLASVWKQTDRRVKARRMLNRLARRQDAEAWRFEIDAELTRLAGAKGETPQGVETNEPTEDAPTTPIATSEERADSPAEANEPRRAA